MVFQQAGTGAVARTVQAKLRETVSVTDFGADPTGVADCTAAINAAIAALPATGGTILFPAGSYRVNSAINLVSNLRLIGQGKYVTTIKPGAILANLGIFNLTAQPSLNDYYWKNVSIEGLGFDGSALTYPVWLSKLDGTPIIDPQNDYVMGTGALASGITGTSITATVTSGTVTALAIVNGGAGWRGHATYPYLSNNVALKFTGGGASRSAYGFATILGGTLTGYVIQDGGTGYTSAPTVTALGGYADINLLVQPGTNRRNPNASTRSFAIQVCQVDKFRVRDCYFKNMKSNCVNVLGSRDAYVEDCVLENCGKNDGNHWGVAMAGYYNAGTGVYVYGDNNIIRRCKSTGDGRTFAWMSPEKGGAFTDNVTSGAGMCSGNSATNAQGGTLLISRNKGRLCRFSDFSAAFCEYDGG
jgi:polygalacturonase